MDFTFTTQLFPDGTLVSVYEAQGYDSFPVSGPPGNAVTAATVESSVLEFTGLDEGTPYFAAAKVAGEWRSTRFTAELPPSVGVETQVLSSGVLHAPEREETLDVATKDELDSKSLASLADVDLTGIAARDHLLWDGDEVVPQRNPLFNVRDFGAEGDGATDDAAAIQAAVDAASAAGGGRVYLPPGTYLVGTTIALKALVHLCGAGFAATICKLKDEAEVDVLLTTGYGSAGIADFSIRDLSIDGNKANNLGEGGGSGLLIDGQRFLLENIRIFNCAGDGLNAQCTTDGEDIKGGTESFCKNIKVWTCGSRNIRWDIHDGHLVNVVGIHKNEVAEPTLTNILIDSNAGATKAIGCHAWGASKYAWHVKASLGALGCEAEGGVSANVYVETDNMRWIGGKVFRDGSNRGKVGFQFAAGKGNNSLIEAVRFAGCEEGDLKFTGEAHASLISSCLSEQAAGKKMVVGTPGSSVTFVNLKVEGGGTVGIAQTLKRSVPASGNNFLDVRVDGDAAARYLLEASGWMWWGGGASLDVSMRRLEAEKLKVEGKLAVAQEVEIDGDLNHDGTKVGFFGVSPTTKPTALTTANAETVDGTYGAPEANVVNNLRTRLNELETKLKAVGLLS